MKHEFVSALFSGGDTDVEWNGVIVRGKEIEEVELAPGKSVKVRFTPQKKERLILSAICPVIGNRG